MTINPFTRNAIRSPNLLIGRKRLLDLLRTNVAGGPVLLHGGRRTGKSSVLRCLASEETSNIKWWYWDVQSILEGGLDGACKQHGGDHSLITEIQKVATDGKRLVLLIDEFDSLFDVNDRTPPFAPQDFQMLRALLQQYDQHFGLIAAISRRISEIEMRGSNLTNVFFPVDMKSLELEAPEQFYQQYLEQAGVANAWDEKQELFGKALEYSGMHPWLLQLAGGVVYTANSINEYYEGIQALGDMVTKTAGYALYSLDEAEAIWFCLCCQRTSGVEILNHSEYEALGLTTKGIIPGAIRLAALNWLKSFDKENQKQDGFQNWEHIVSRLTGKHLSEAMQDDRHALVEAVRYRYLTIASNGTLQPSYDSCCGGE